MNKKIALLNLTRKWYFGVAGLGKEESKESAVYTINLRLYKVSERPHWKYRKSLTLNPPKWHLRLRRKRGEIAGVFIAAKQGDLKSWRSSGPY
jgi:hypothetical protein